MVSIWTQKKTGAVIWDLCFARVHGGGFLLSLDHRVFAPNSSPRGSPTRSMDCERYRKAIYTGEFGSCRSSGRSDLFPFWKRIIKMRKTGCPVATRADRVPSPFCCCLVGGSICRKCVQPENKNQALPSSNEKCAKEVGPISLAPKENGKCRIYFRVFRKS